MREHSRDRGRLEAKDYSVEDIAEITGLTAEEIESL